MKRPKCKIKFCCKGLEESLKLEGTSFTVIGKHTILLYLGNTHVRGSARNRLLKLILEESAAPVFPANKKYKSQVMVPINFCPFCGKRITTPVHPSVGVFKMRDAIKF